MIENKIKPKKWGGGDEVGRLKQNQYKVRAMVRLNLFILLSFYKYCIH